MNEPGRQNKYSHRASRGLRWPQWWKVMTVVNYLHTGDQSWLFTQPPSMVKAYRDLFDRGFTVHEAGEAMY